MMPTGSLSPTALSWVRKDLDRELDKVRMQVESIAGNPNSGAVVFEGTAERIQDLNLIFETLVLDGARQITGEMHRLVSSLGKGSVSDRDAANSALAEAMVVLPAYLDRLQAGHQDLPLLLLPLINQLRTSIGEEALSGGAVFSPLLDVELPELEFVRKPGFDEPFEYLTSRLHRQYEKALQNWLQDQDDTSLLSPMQGICETMRHRVKRYDLKRLWWVATEVFGGLMDGKVRNDVHLRRLMARLGLLIHAMADDDEDGIDERTSTSITQALLFHVLNAESGCEGVDLVRERFELDRLAPDSEDMMRARGTLSGRDREMYQSLSAAVEDELSIVKDALDLELRTGEVESERRKQSMEALARLADTLGMLGLSGPGREISGLVPAFEETAGAERSEREHALERLAEQLLLVESALKEQIETLGESVEEEELESFIALSPHEHRRIHADLLDECVASMHAAEDAVRERFAGRAGTEPGEPLGLVSGALRMIGEVDSAELTEALADTLQRLLRRSREGTELSRSDIEAVADAMAALELFLSARRDRQRDAPRFSRIVHDRLGHLASRLVGLRSVGTGAVPAPTATVEAPAAAPEPVEAPVERTEAEAEPIDARAEEEAADHLDTPAEAPETEPEEIEALAEEPEAEEATTEAPVDEPEAEAEAEADAEADFESLGTLTDDVAEPEPETAESMAGDEDLAAAPADVPEEVTPALADTDAEPDDDSGLAAVDFDSWSDTFEPKPAKDKKTSEAESPKPRSKAPSVPQEDDVLPMEIDPELREIFLEEYEEVLQSLQAAIPTWINQMDNADALTEIRRAFHTLKGSGRMVGADELGDFSWQIENMLNTLLEGRSENFADASVMVRLAEASLPALRQRMLQEHAGLTQQLIQIIGDLAEQVSRGKSADWASLQPRLPMYLAGLLPGGVSRTETPAEASDAPSDEMDTMLREELTEHLGPVRDLVGAITQDRGTRASEEQVRAVHTIAGALAMRPEGLDAQVAKALEGLFTAQARSGTAYTPDAMFTVIGALGQLQNRLDRLEGMGDLSPEAEQQELIDHLERLTPQFEGLGAEPEAEETAAPAEAAFDPGHSVFGGKDEDADEGFTFESALDTEDEEPVSLAPTPAGKTPETVEAREETPAAEDIEEDAPELEAAPEPEAPAAPPLPEPPRTPAAATPAFVPPAAPRPMREVAEAEDSTTSEGLDEEIVGIFLEEAAEVLERGDSALQEWRDDLENLEWVQELQREIHTFKGGARMAGLASIGDYTHEMEELLERIAERVESPSLSAVQVLEDACDRLHGWVEQVEQGRNPDASAALDLLRQQIQGLGDVSLRPDEAVAAPEPPPAPRVAVDIVEAPEPAVTRGPEPASDTDVDDAGQGGSIRVAAELLDRLVNASGEVSIYRSRLEQQIGKLKGNLSEFDETIDRLSEQFRKMDIEIEAQIRANYPDEVEARGANFDPLELDQFSALQQATRSLQESVADLLSLQEMAEENLRASEQLLTRQSRVSNELQEGLMKTRMVPFGTVAPRLRRILRQAAKDEGKQARLQLRMVGSSDELDRNVLEHITAPLEHMMRNAVAHGVEKPALRRERGKPAEGEITITVESEATEFVIRIADDGGGINLDAIRARAIERGLLDEHTEPTRQQLYDFMMDSGFSTSSSVTRLAGRGVGMDVVNSEVKQIGGSLEIDSEPGQGTQFTIRIPFTLAIMQAIGLEAGDARYLLPLSSVVGVSRLLPDDYRKLVDQPDPRYKFAGQEYPVLDIEPLLGERGTPLGRDNVSLLILSAGEQKAAVRVPQLLPHREVVIKPVGPQISSVAGVLGGSISGDGEVMVILDPGPMIRRALLQGVGPSHQQASVTLSSNKRLVLVVDDSITMRKVTSRVLEGHDFDVITARDGVDALEQLQDRTPDIMLFDIEMPRMDGYELTERVRDDGRFRQTPIMMITSRAGQKHRDRAMQAGATAYLTKPYREDQLLQEVERLLEEAKA